MPYVIIFFLVDPCLAGLDFYEAENHCRSYFKCNGETTEEMLCCQIGDKYDPVSKTCVLDITRECLNDVCTDGPALVDYRKSASRRNLYLLLDLIGVLTNTQECFSFTTAATEHYNVSRKLTDLRSSEGGRETFPNRQ